MFQAFADEEELDGLEPGATDLEGLEADLDLGMDVDSSDDE